MALAFVVAGRRRCFRRIAREAGFEQVSFVFRRCKQWGRLVQHRVFVRDDTKPLRTQLPDLARGVGAVAYSMYCPVDSVAFVTTWYVIAIALCAAFGALIVSRFLRW